MLPEFNANLLVNDSQLGDHLNRAVIDGRRSDFGLLLALISEDARDLPRIEEPKSEQGQTDWRAFFDLPAQDPLYADPQDDIRAPQLSALAGDLQQDSLRLLLAMRAEPLRVSNERLPAEVTGNLNPRILARLSGELGVGLPVQPERMLEVLNTLKVTA
ncbi:VC2046/SO_2500 family protein [Oceanisphaera sp. KMM 10153]|uniref:VC2046/SO_2500 family protein n=1 Tax=Oceanisphaera submarina TaxID=3390193 RepID=UPI003976FDA1